jgi:hypothetical protein
VESVIGLLTSEKNSVPKLARRTLSQLFVPDVAADREVVPRNGELVPVRIDNVPDYPTLQKAWRDFWEKDRKHYTQNANGDGLVRGG